MFTIKDLKDEAKALLRKDDNYYFPGIWLYLVPLLILALPLEQLMKGTPLGILIGIISLVVLSFFGAWFILWAVNLAYGKEKRIRDAIPNFKIYLVYLVINAIVQIINLFLIKINPFFSIVGLIIGEFGCAIILLSIVSYVKEGKFNCSKISSLLGKTFIKLVILQISFIPLYFLIGITFGVVYFWKITYMQESLVLVAKKIYENELE
ncbi:MAG: hypothetical protein ACRDD2_05825 [Sarcina sp.]